MKMLYLVAAFLVMSATLTAQPSAKKRPVKAPAPEAPLNLPLEIKQDNGESSFFDLKKGDQLVYHVNAGGREYDFIVTLNSYGKNGIDFNYTMTSPADKEGHVTISPKAMSSSKKYSNYFSGGELKLTNATTVWMCYDNFSDMPKKKTTMTMDDGAPETFYRPDKDEVNPVIKVKGKEMKIDAFIINNKSDGTGDKTLWINGISSNPLILKMDLGWVIELKEIR